MDAKISLVLACLAVLFTQGSALRCYTCQALASKPMGVEVGSKGPGHWTTHYDDMSSVADQDHCWGGYGDGDHFRMYPTEAMECPEQVGMKPVCSLTHSWWNQTLEGSEVDMKFVSRNCTLITEKELNMWKGSDGRDCTEDISAYKKPEQGNFRGDSCSCIKDYCNADNGQITAGAGHVTISTFLLMAAVVAAINW